MLKGRTALITGSTAGQGARIAAALAAEGANILLTGLGEPTEVEKQRATLSSSYGVNVAYFDADLRSEGAIVELVQFGYSNFGCLDIVINNAVVRKGNPVESYRSEDWSDEIAINLTAAFHVIRLTIEGMRKNGWGRIINISSNHGIFGAANRAGYVTTKTALLGLTRAIAMETAFTGITCNAVCPSAMLGLNSEAQIRKFQESGRTREEAEQAYLKARKSTRWVETLPEVIAFLCSNAARDIHGATLPVDLGSTAGRPSA